MTECYKSTIDKDGGDDENKMSTQTATISGGRLR
jgi:hypothetical protein